MALDRKRDKKKRFKTDLRALIATAKNETIDESADKVMAESQKSSNNDFKNMLFRS